MRFLALSGIANGAVLFHWSICLRITPRLFVFETGLEPTLTSALVVHLFNLAVRGPGAVVFDNPNHRIAFIPKS
jgi:hypothetical protein